MTTKETVTAKLLDPNDVADGHVPTVVIDGNLAASSLDLPLQHDGLMIREKLFW